MKKILALILLVGSVAFAEDFGHCDIREDNKKEWEIADIKISYELGRTIQEIMEDYPEYTYEEIYFIVKNPEERS